MMVSATALAHAFLLTQSRFRVKASPDVAVLVLLVIGRLTGGGARGAPQLCASCARSAFHITLSLREEASPERDLTQGREAVRKVCCVALGPGDQD